MSVACACSAPTTPECSAVIPIAWLTRGYARFTMIVVCVCGGSRCMARPPRLRPRRRPASLLPPPSPPSSSRHFSSSHLRPSSEPEAAVAATHTIWHDEVSSSTLSHTHGPLLAAQCKNLNAGCWHLACSAAPWPLPVLISDVGVSPPHLCRSAHTFSSVPVKIVSAEGDVT